MSIVKDELFFYGKLPKLNEAELSIFFYYNQISAKKVCVYHVCPVEGAYLIVHSCSNTHYGSHHE